MQTLDIALSIVAILSSLGCALFFGYLSTTERKAPRFADSIRQLPEVAEKSSLTVIITARNEEETIGRCLGSLTSQTYPELEILVVDDSSNDDTCKIVRDYTAKSPRIRLEEAGAKPEGWVGKSWPCWRGYELSTSEYLLFADADSWFEPQTVELAMNYMISGGIDVLSISPKIHMSGVWAKAVVPIITGAINLLYPMFKVNDRKSNRAYVFGTFILIKREAYESIGGHAAVREEIVEDAAIGRLAKTSGKKLRVEIGTEYLTTEWEKKPSSIYNGIERVASSSIRSYGLLSLLNAVLLFFVGLYPMIFFLGFAVALIEGLRLGLVLWIGFVASVLGVALFILLSSMELNMIREKVGLAPLLYPLGVAFFLSAIITTSIKVSTGKGIGWKGAKYQQQVEETSQTRTRKLRGSFEKFAIGNSSKHKHQFGLITHPH